MASHRAGGATKEVGRRSASHPTRWAEWAETLGGARAHAATNGAPDLAETYYQDWLAALEQMVTAKGLADAAALSRTRDAWNRAAKRTPHGTPIELGSEDFR